MHILKYFLFILLLKKIKEKTKTKLFVFLLLENVSSLKEKMFPDLYFTRVIEVSKLYLEQINCLKYFKWININDAWNHWDSIVRKCLYPGSQNITMGASN